MLNGDYEKNRERKLITVSTFRPGNASYKVNNHEMWLLLNIKQSNKKKKEKKNFALFLIDN